MNNHTQLPPLEPASTPKPSSKSYLLSSPPLAKSSTVPAKRPLDLPSFSPQSPSPNFYSTLNPKLSPPLETPVPAQPSSPRQLPSQPDARKSAKPPAGDSALIDPDLQDIATHLGAMEERLTRQIFWLKKGLRIAERKIDFQRKLLWFLVFLFSGLLFSTTFSSPQNSSPSHSAVPQLNRE